MDQNTEFEAIKARHEAAKQALDDERYYSGRTPPVFPTNEGKRAHDDRATLLRKVDEQAARERKDYQYARNLLLSLYRKHFPEGKGIEPLDDLSGVLTQIDNLTTALTRAAKET